MVYHMIISIIIARIDCTCIYNCILIVFVEDLSASKPVYASTVEDGSDLSDIVDKDKGTCATIGKTDRPWLVVDLGQEMRIHGVSLKIPTGLGKST